MTGTHRKTFFSDFRTFFVKGLVILLPSLITLGILLWAFNFLQTNIAGPINWAVRGVVLETGPMFYDPESEALPSWLKVNPGELEEAIRDLGIVPADATEDQRLAARDEVRAEKLKDAWADRWYLQGIGFVIAIIFVYLAGFILGNYLGKRFYTRVERYFIRVPVIKQVYPNVKQIIDFLLGNEDEKLPQSGKVVLVEYPRKGIWTVGLMTGGTLRSIEQIAGDPCITVFIPSSPTPFTGYTITVPSKDVHELAISFDEAIRFVVSGGVLVPEREQSGASVAVDAQGFASLPSHPSDSENDSKSSPPA